MFAGTPVTHQDVRFAFFSAIEVVGFFFFFLKNSFKEMKRHDMFMLNLSLAELKHPVREN